MQKPRVRIINKIVSKLVRYKGNNNALFNQYAYVAYTKIAWTPQEREIIMLSLQQNVGIRYEDLKIYADLHEKAIQSQAVVQSNPIPAFTPLNVSSGWYDSGTILNLENSSLQNIVNQIENLPDGQTPPSVTRINSESRRRNTT